MAAQTDALANLYARSLFELAQEAGGKDKILEVASEFEQLNEVLRTDKKIAAFFASPIIDKNQRSESLRRIFSDRITDLFLRFILVLNDKGRLQKLNGIATAFDQLVQEAFGKIEVDVYTAAPLDRQQLDSIRQRIQKAMNKEPVLHPYTEPAMIGGVKLRIGDRLIDGSVASRLRRMKQGLHAHGGSRLRQKMNRIIEESS